MDKGNRHVRFDASSIGRLSTRRFYERVTSAVISNVGRTKSSVARINGRISRSICATRYTDAVTVITSCLFLLRVRGYLGNCVNTIAHSFPYLTPFVYYVFASFPARLPPRALLTRLSCTTSNRATFSYTLSYDAEFLSRLSHPGVEKDGRGRCRRDGMKDKRAVEKGTVRWTKKYGRETAEIDIFPPCMRGKNRL